MKTLQRYIFKRLSAMFMLAFLPFFLLQFVIRLIVEFEEMSRLGISGVLLEVFYFTLDSSSFMLTFFFYLSCFITFIFFNSRFELPAIRALGAGKGFVALPVLLFGLLLGTMDQTLGSTLLSGYKKDKAENPDSRWTYKEGILTSNTASNYNVAQQDFFSIFMDDFKILLIAKSDGDSQVHWQIGSKNLTDENAAFNLIASNWNEHKSSLEPVDYGSVSIFSLAGLFSRTASIADRLEIAYNIARKIGSLLSFLLFGLLAVLMSDLPPRKYGYIRAVVACIILWIAYAAMDKVGELMRPSTLIGAGVGGLLGSLSLAAFAVGLVFYQKAELLMRARRV